MASPRYTLNIKPEDLQPDAPPPEMTAKEKRENFWFYHKWHVIVGIVAAALIGSFIWEIVSQVHPDYTVSLLSTSALPTGIGEAMGEQLATLLDDRNGDGQVKVTVMEYCIGKGDAAMEDPNTRMANMTKLMGDVDAGDSMLFLTDDLAYFEEQFRLFAYDDGTSPADGETPDYTRMGVRWGDCPALAALELGESEGFGEYPGIDYQDFLQDYRLVLRCFAGTKLEKQEDKAADYVRAMELFRAWSGR